MGPRAPESKNGDHFFTRTPPQNGGLGICFMCLPRKVIFGHFIDFEYFGSDFSCFYIVKEIKTSNGHTKAIYGSIMLKFFLWARITQWHHIWRRQNVTKKSRFAEHPTDKTNLLALLSMKAESLIKDDFSHLLNSGYEVPLRTTRREWTDETDDHRRPGRQIEKK